MHVRFHWNCVTLSSADTVQHEVEPWREDLDSDLVHYELLPRERRGWWINHSLGEDRSMVAMVRGAVCGTRVKIMLDSGATTNIISPSLVRRLGLKVSYGQQLTVSGFAGSQTQIEERTRLKIPLGDRMVYYLEAWVGHIGQDIECLLGMSFMRRAGVRLCAREQVVLLPDEKSIPLVRAGEAGPASVDITVSPNETIWLSPGQSYVHYIAYQNLNPAVIVVWAGRGDQWVTQLVGPALTPPSPIRVTSVSGSEAVIHPYDVLARLLKPDAVPSAGRFVRRGTLRYQEWGCLVFENTASRDQKREQEYERWLLEKAATPAVEHRKYVTPTKILSRTQPGTEPQSNVGVGVMVVMSKPNFEVQSVGEPVKRGAETEPEETGPETAKCQAEGDPVV